MGILSKGITFANGEQVTSSRLNNLVDNATFTNNAVDGATITLQSGALAAGVMQTANIAVNAITTNRIGDDAVTTIKIANDAVTTAKIIDDAVTTAKILDANVTPAKLSQPLTLLTAQASTSGTSIDFTGIPPWAKRITIMFDGVSTNGVSAIGVGVGTSAGFITSGYEGGASNQVPNYLANTNCLLLNFSTTPAAQSRGHAILTLISENRWIFSAGVQLGTTNLAGAGGAITLPGILDRIRITTVNGTDTFDAGSINIMYE